MEEKIALYMKNLGLTRDEAIQLIKDDEADVSVELSKSQVEVVKKMTRTTGDKTERRVRQRKPDNDKREIIQTLDDALCDLVDNVIVINPEREIQIEFNGALYKVTLSKPRTK